MFRLDEDRVVDATLSGGLARYINHSCNPNCVTEIVEVDREFRIIIFAKRRINRGEEVNIHRILSIFFLNLSVHFIYFMYLFSYSVDHENSSFSIIMKNFTKEIFNFLPIYSCHTITNSILRTIHIKYRACAVHQIAANG